MKFNLGHIILLGTLLISIPRYAAAFSQAEPTFLGMTIAPVTGLGAAILLEAGVYYVINAWFAANRRGLKWDWLLLAGFIAQLVIGPVIVAPAIVGHMLANPGELSRVLETREMLWLWAVVVAAAPALLLAAATAASFMQQPAGKRPEPSEPKQDESQQKAGSAGFACGICGRAFKTQPALNAHQKAHAGLSQLEPAEPAIETSKNGKEHSHVETI